MSATLQHLDGLDRNARGSGLTRLNPEYQWETGPARWTTGDLAPAVLCLLAGDPLPQQNKSRTLSLLRAG